MGDVRSSELVLPKLQSKSMMPPELGAGLAVGGGLAVLGAWQEAAVMERFRSRAAIFAALGLGVAGAGVFGLQSLTRKPARETPQATSTPSTSKVNIDSSLADLSTAIAHGDGMALAVLKARLETKPAEGTVVEPMTEAQAAEWAGALSSLRAGFSRYSGYGRASSAVVSSLILQKFAASPAPPNWRSVLAPAAEVLQTAIADGTWEVRVAAMNELKTLWRWTPRREFVRSELNELIAWKQQFHGSLVARLKDREKTSRIAAVSCLGQQPDVDAEAAARHLDDPDADVRLQVLISFADRPSLVSEEAILPLLYDSSEFVRPMAERVLKARGLSPEQIGLGKLVVHPRADMRLTALPFLKNRDDIDPVVWLLYLSRDREETVRMKALEELAGHSTPEARQRVSEMAAGDVSPAIRARAEKLRPAGDSTAEALPPLPGSGTMGLKAN